MGGGLGDSIAELAGERHPEGNEGPRVWESSGCSKDQEASVAGAQSAGWGGVRLQGRGGGETQARTHGKELEFHSKFNGKPLRAFKKPLIKKNKKKTKAEHLLR